MGADTTVESAAEKLAQVAITSDDEDEDNESIEGIEFVDYMDESQLESVMELVGRDLSEPYSSKSIYRIKFNVLRWKILLGTHRVWFLSSLYISILPTPVPFPLLARCFQRFQQRTHWLRGGKSRRRRSLSAR
jgi:hypothetical protein